MSAPFDLGPLQECFAVEREAEELAAMKRRLSAIAAQIYGIAMPVLVGIATLFATTCAIGQIMVLIRSLG